MLFRVGAGVMSADESWRGATLHVVRPLDRSARGGASWSWARGTPVGYVYSFAHVMLLNLISGHNRLQERLSASLCLEGHLGFLEAYLLIDYSAAAV